MSKVNIGDLREVAKKANEEEAQVEISGLDIRVKQYLPIIDKINLLIDAYTSAWDEEGFDEFLFDITYRVGVVESYTNIKTPKDTMDTYDLIMSTGVFNGVWLAINEGERKELEDYKVKYIRTQKKTEEKQNSLSFLVGKVLENMGEMELDQDSIKELVREQL